MNKWFNTTLAVVLLSLGSFTEEKAQGKIVLPENKTVSQKKDSLKVKPVAAASISFKHKGKIVRIPDSVRQGSELVVEVEWNPKVLDKIVFDTTVYKMTPEDLKNCKYSFVIKPKKTTAYRMDYVDKQGVDSWLRVIRVVDENGKEIKGEKTYDRPIIPIKKHN